MVNQLYPLLLIHPGKLTWNKGKSSEPNLRSPKWWFNGNLPCYKVKKHLKQIQEMYGKTVGFPFLRSILWVGVT